MHFSKQEMQRKLEPNVKWISDMAIHSSGDHIIVGDYSTRLAWIDTGESYYMTSFHDMWRLRAYFGRLMSSYLRVKNSFLLQERYLLPGGVGSDFQKKRYFLKKKHHFPEQIFFRFVSKTVQNASISQESNSICSISWKISVILFWKWWWDNNCVSWESL